jgi:urease accessory protein
MEALARSETGPEHAPGSTIASIHAAINKKGLAPHVGADLSVMDRDARAMRGDGPFLFTQVNKDVGVPEVTEHILAAWREVLGKAA